MKIKTCWATGLRFACVGAWLGIAGCEKPEEPKKPEISAADKAAADKAIADKALADKASADKIAADKAAVVKAAADKDAADKAAVVKAAADKAAAEDMAAAASLPPDLVEFKAEIVRTMSQLDITMAKLDALSAATGNLKKPSQDAVDAITALDTETKSLKKRADDMRERGAAYFEAWEKQLAAMSTPAVAAIAAKRKDELSAKYAEVLTAMQASRAAYDPFWADLQAIQQAIEDGLTPEKQKNLAPQIKAAKDKAAGLKSRVEAVTSKLHQVGDIYTKA